MKVKLLLISLVLASSISLIGCGNTTQSADNSATSTLSESIALENLTYNVKSDTANDIWEITDSQTKSDIDSIINDIITQNEGTLISEMSKEPTETYLDIIYQDKILKTISIYQQNNTYNLNVKTDDNIYSYSLSNETGEKFSNLLNKPN